MARSDIRYSVYPAPKAVEFLGNSAPALNRAIECWAALVARAMADNAKTIWNYGAFEPGDYVLKEWCVLAEAFKEMPFNPEFANPGELLATAVEDANRLDNIGANWFSTEREDRSYIEMIDECVAKLGKKLRGLDYAHSWAVTIAVEWYWEHHDEGVDIKKDEWWTLAFRRQWQMKKAKKPPKRKR